MFFISSRKPSDLVQVVTVAVGRGRLERRQPVGNTGKPNIHFDTHNDFSSETLCLETKRNRLIILVYSFRRYIV